MTREGGHTHTQRQRHRIGWRADPCLCRKANEAQPRGSQRRRVLPERRPRQLGRPPGQQRKSLTKSLGSHHDTGWRRVGGHLKVTLAPSTPRIPPFVQGLTLGTSSERLSEPTCAFVSPCAWRGSGRIHSAPVRWRQIGAAICLPFDTPLVDRGNEAAAQRTCTMRTLSGRKREKKNPKQNSSVCHARSMSGLFDLLFFGNICFIVRATRCCFRQMAAECSGKQRDPTRIFLPNSGFSIFSSGQPGRGRGLGERQIKIPIYV